MQEPDFEESSRQQPEITPAEQLGLPKQVNVVRTSGEVQSDWRVHSFSDFNDPNTNEVNRFVNVVRANPDGRELLKTVRLSDLQQWNAQPDQPELNDDTVPLEAGRVMGDRVKEPDLEPNSEIKEAKIVNLSGDVALRGAGIELPEPVQQEVDNPRVHRAMVELNESWGLPEGTTAEQAAVKIETELERVNGVLKLLHGFDGVRGSVVNQLHASLNEGKMLLTGSGRRALEEMVYDKRFAGLQRLASGGDKAFLPAKISGRLKDFERSLNGLRYGLDEMNSRGPNFIDTEGAQITLRSLRQMPEITALLSQARSRLEEARQDLVGYKETERSTETETIKYRNERIEMLSQELVGEVTPERLEEIIQETEASITLEVGMVDDPNSPHRWFGDRILANTNKDRARVDITGRQEHKKASSRRYVAELMVDMMRGMFRADLAYDAIVLSNKSVGGVKLGQHRAAALAMLYGNEWPKIVDKLGHKVERE